MNVAPRPAVHVLCPRPVLCDDPIRAHVVTIDSARTQGTDNNLIPPFLANCSHALVGPPHCIPECFPDLCFKVLNHIVNFIVESFLFRLAECIPLVSQLFVELAVFTKLLLRPST